MSDALQAALGLANKIGFAERFDPQPFSPRNTHRHQARRLRAELLKTAVRIHPMVTPDLARMSAEVCAELKIPEGQVEIFITADSQINALCIPNGASCIVHLTSGIVNLLGNNELKFVLGHELGHWLMGVQGHVSDKLARYQEVVADRFGLLACTSLTDATRAVMMTTSGLAGQHLRFDVQQFLGQLDEVGHSVDGFVRTHPANVVRCKALVIFEVAVRSGLTMESVRRANKIIDSDLERFHRSDEEKYIVRYRKWFFVSSVLSTHQFFPVELQDLFKSLFSEDDFEGVQSFLRLFPFDQWQSQVEARLRSTRAHLDRYTDFDAIHGEILHAMQQALA